MPINPDHLKYTKSGEIHPVAAKKIQVLLGFGGVAKVSNWTTGSGMDTKRAPLPDFAQVYNRPRDAGAGENDLVVPDIYGDLPAHVREYFFANPRVQAVVAFNVPVQEIRDFLEEATTLEFRLARSMAAGNSREEALKLINQAAAKRDRKAELARRVEERRMNAHHAHHAAPAEFVALFQGLGGTGADLNEAAAAAAQHIAGRQPLRSFLDAALSAARQVGMIGKNNGELRISFRTALFAAAGYEPEQAAEYGQGMAP